MNFKIVDKECREFRLVEKAFENLIAQYYGPQDAALVKIGKGEDRLCEMLFDRDEAQGIIIYKKSLQQGSLELKTLCLLNPEQNSKKGYGTILFNRVVDVANQRRATHVRVSVSEQNRAALAFFERKGFRCDRKVSGIYASNNIEHFLSYQVVPRQLSSNDRITPGGTLRGYAAQQHPVPSNSRYSPPQALASRPDIHCTLKKTYINALKSGAKTFEGRVATRFFDSYTPGKTVEWYCGSNVNDKVLTKITERTTHRSFREMLTTHGYEKFVPEATSLEHAVSLYDKIPGYTEKVNRFGALALGLSLFSNPSSSARAAERMTDTNSSHRSKRPRDESYTSDRGVHADRRETKYSRR